MLSNANITSKEFFDQAGIQYEEAFGHDPGLQRVVERFIGLLSDHARVLDCGCGTGKPVAKMIAESGRQVHGIDLSQTMVELSSKQVPTGSFEKANMLDYTPAERMDGVIASLSMFELTREQITSMAQKWFLWLRPNGYLLICMFGADDFKTPLERYDSDGLFARDIPFTFMNHQVFMNLFTKAGWNNMLKEEGFDVVYTETDIFTPPQAAVSDDEPHYFIIARRPSDL